MLDVDFDEVLGVVISGYDIVVAVEFGDGSGGVELVDELEHVLGWPSEAIIINV